MENRYSGILPGESYIGIHALADFFCLRLKYPTEGLSKDQRAWMPYEDLETRFPLIFHPFDDALNKDHDLMMAINTVRAIPVNTFGSGKNSIPTYEFYNPSALARQLAFGQLSIGLCYADVVKPRRL